MQFFTVTLVTALLTITSAIPVAHHPAVDDLAFPTLSVRPTRTSGRFYPRPTGTGIRGRPPCGTGTGRPLPTFTGTGIPRPPIPTGTGIPRPPIPSGTDLPLPPVETDIPEEPEDPEVPDEPEPTPTTAIEGLPEETGIEPPIIEGEGVESTPVEVEYRM